MRNLFNQYTAALTCRARTFFVTLIVGLLMSGGAVADHLLPAPEVFFVAANKQLPNNLPLTVKRIELSASPALQARVQAALQREVHAIKAAFQHRHSVHVSRVRLHADRLELVGHRMVRSAVPRASHSDTPGVHNSAVRVWLEEVTLTIPRHYLTSAWDVVSLEKELERLGIKIKPKPTAPKPTSAISG
jgi:hypothetical protein